MSGKKKGRESVKQIRSKAKQTKKSKVNVFVASLNKRKDATALVLRWNKIIILELP